MFAVIHLLLYLDRHLEFGVALFCGSDWEAAIEGFASVQLLQVLKREKKKKKEKKVVYNYFQAHSACTENKSIYWWAFFLHHRQIFS